MYVNPCCWYELDDVVVDLSNSSDSLVVETRRYGEGAGRILPHEVNCEGTESSLEECDLSNFHSSRCGHSKDVGLICNEGKKEIFNDIGCSCPFSTKYFFNSTISLF